MESICARSDGALYFSSAGNSGNLNDGISGVWEGDFQDGGTLPLFPDGTLHDFGGGLLYNTITSPGASNVLTWSDVFNAATNDYDMFMLIKQPFQKFLSQNFTLSNYDSVNS